MHFEFGMNERLRNASAPLAHLDGSDGKLGDNNKSMNFVWIYDNLWGVSNVDVIQKELNL